MWWRTDIYAGKAPVHIGQMNKNLKAKQRPCSTERADLLAFYPASQSGGRYKGSHGEMLPHPPPPSFCTVPVSPSGDEDAEDRGLAASASPCQGL